MALTIVTESYGRRLPKITAEADSTDDLATLGTNYAEGSTCVIGDKTYSLDKVQGWVEHGSGGGGGMFVVTFTQDKISGAVSADKTPEEIEEAAATHFVFGREVYPDDSVYIAYSFIGVHRTGDNTVAVFNRVTFEKGDLLGVAREYTINKDKSVTVDEWAWTVEDDS